MVYNNAVRKYPLIFSVGKKEIQLKGENMHWIRCDTSRNASQKSLCGQSEDRLFTSIVVKALYSFFYYVSWGFKLSCHRGTILQQMENASGEDVLLESQELVTILPSGETKRWSSLIFVPQRLTFLGYLMQCLILPEWAHCVTLAFCILPAASHSL